MKNYTILIAILILFSCSEKTTEKDPLIGSWKLIKSANIYKKKKTVEHPPSPCFSETRFIFKKDGTFHYKWIEKNKETGECYEKPKDFWTGSWKVKKGGNYVITNIFKYSKENIVVSIDSTNTYTFADNNNRLKIYNDFEKSGTSVLDEVVIADYVIYEKVD
ncbi:lipocalin family protein [Winogradskyella sp. 3972H.M.0a.05]|uniref:lipocalin family protein n=1 Tax=Winogradskyella sp. 3972H.M.0a.05 TaxID=2950277 RepID=UPI00339B0153